MHAIKGGWVGQTFALAKQNESGGKKSRIRRSKEERKTMVEAFIKKYQSLNNGNFPSLNLTHKEAGGSFYTVREIVREIIQENRVLGPAKLAPDAQNTYWLSEQYPLGSIATEPQMSLSESPQGNALTPDHHLGSSDDLVNSSFECSAGLETQGSESRQIINGNHVILKDKVSDTGTESKSSETLRVEKASAAVSKTTEILDMNEAIVDVSASDASETQEMDITAEELPASYACAKMYTDKAVEILEEFSASDANETLEMERTVETFTASDASEILEVEKTDKEPSAYDAIETLDTQKTVEEFSVYKANVTLIAEADVVVETFPRLASKSTDSLSSNPEDLAASLEEKVVQNVNSGLVNDFPLSDGISSSENSAYKSIENSSGPLLDKNSDSVPKKAVEKNPEVEMLGASNGTATNEGTVQYMPVNTNTKIDNLVSKTQGQDRFISETATNSAVNCIQVKNLERPQAAGSIKESIDREGVAIENKADLFQKKENKADFPPTSSPDKQSNPVLDRTKLESWEKTSRSSTEPELNPLWAVVKSFIAAFVKFWSE